jgi:hypothetical protein
MDMRNVQHKVVAQEWKQRILDQRSSGLSVRKWCTDHNVRESRYYYWLHVLRSEELALRKPVAAGGFAELRLEASATETGGAKISGICAVIRGQNMSLEIHNGADPMTLDLAMRALGIGRG